TCLEPDGSKACFGKGHEASRPQPNVDRVVPGSGLAHWLPAGVEQWIVTQRRSGRRIASVDGPNRASTSTGKIAQEFVMKAYQERVFQSFRRVQGWFEANPSYRLTAPSEVAMALATQVDALSGVVARLTEHVAQQETQAAQSLLISKDEREQRIEVLSHHMGTISKTARALRGVVPGIGVLAMPKGNIESAALITAALVMARKAEVYSSVLVENGLLTVFL